MHPDQLPISVETARQLIREQFPQWADQRTETIESEGTLNAIFRVGDDLAARFQLLPRDPSQVQVELEREAAACRELAEHVSVSTPLPVALGQPGAGYPLPWSVQTWLPGSTATQDDPGESAPFAQDLATFIAEVRSIDRRGRTFTGDGRGGQLTDHDEWLEHCFSKSEAYIDVPLLRAIWCRLRELPSHPEEAMCHGDLTPGNVLTKNGRLVGVIDAGGLGPADPSLDLVSAWHLLEKEARSVLRAQLRCHDLEWERGKAWALQQGMGAVWYYASSNPPMSRWARRTLMRIAAAEP